MTNFEILSDMRAQGVLNELIKRGIVPISYLDFMSLYETFSGLDEGLGLMERYRETAAIHLVHINTVIRTVKIMESA